MIATRNRTEALKISVPLILNQDQPPRRLIIVDASDDHEAAQQLISHIAHDGEVGLEVLVSEPNNARQRNIGLARVVSPVVIFPDDDSLWWPGVGEAIMRIYERDKEGDIGGVCGRETRKPPPGIHLAKHDGNKMRISDRVRQQIERVRHKFDDRFCPDPQWVHGRSRWNVRPVPTWLSNENAKLVEYMGGFRMSFRTEVIRQFGGFNEDLGAYVGWAACEDADASFSVMRERLVVGAHDAKVFHYKAPNRRAGGFELGFITLLNRVYVVARHAPPGSPAYRALKRWGIYKLLLYLLEAHCQFGRARVRGTMRALQLMNILLKSGPDQLRQRYLELCQQNIGPGK